MNTSYYKKKPKRVDMGQLKWRIEMKRTTFFLGWQQWNENGKKKINEKTFINKNLRTLDKRNIIHFMKTNETIENQLEKTKENNL